MIGISLQGDGREFLSSLPGLQKCFLAIEPTNELVGYSQLSLTGQMTPVLDVCHDALSRLLQGESHKRRWFLDC